VLIAAVAATVLLSASPTIAQEYDSDTPDVRGRRPAGTMDDERRPGVLPDDKRPGAMPSRPAPGSILEERTPRADGEYESDSRTPIEVPPSDGPGYRGPDAGVRATPGAP